MTDYFSLVSTPVKFRWTIPLKITIVKGYPIFSEEKKKNICVIIYVRFPATCYYS